MVFGVRVEFCLELLRKPDFSLSERIVRLQMVYVCTCIIKRDREVTIKTVLKREIVSLVLAVKSFQYG